MISRQAPATPAVAWQPAPACSPHLLQVFIISMSCHRMSYSYSSCDMWCITSTRKYIFLFVNLFEIYFNWKSWKTRNKTFFLICQFGTLFLSSRSFFLCIPPQSSLTCFQTISTLSQNLYFIFTEISSFLQPGGLLLIICYYSWFLPNYVSQWHSRLQYNVPWPSLLPADSVQVEYFSSYILQ